MAVEDVNGGRDNEKLSLSLPGDELEEFFSLDSPLCVPQDSLDDIDWFPNFADENISLDCFSLTPEPSENCSGNWKNNKKRGVGDEGNDEKSVIGGFTKKKQRTKRAGSGGKRGFWLDSEWNNTKEKRRCSHCSSEKTPQWRIGPLGPKTLCNACGVRYKSGRLVLEYRPAASPTFDSLKHSNVHKKILQRKEIGIQA